MSALTRNCAPNTCPSELMKEYYVQCMQGGVGLIITKGILIMHQGFIFFMPFIQDKAYIPHLLSTEFPHAPGIWDEKHVTSWKTITDAVHDAGGRIYAQAS
jgi:2,4-dienoyl-CoA reductase-like NADH-dependent reductase (Old Yellow Enzyme family)